MTLTNTLQEIRLPQPEEISSRERDQSLAAYFMMFISVAIGFPLPFINVIASILYFYFTKTTSRFVYFHSFQSLISQIAISLMNAIGVSLVFYSIFVIQGLDPWIVSYWGVTILFNLIYFVVSLIAAIQAYKGRLFYFWVTGKWAYRRAFLLAGKEKEAARNYPPQ